MAWDTDLEGKARDIAAYNGSPLRIFAGPGTGKTFSIMRRIARILEEGVEPEKILLVTFTRLAARDLVKKVKNLGIEGVDKIYATTLHSFAFSMLMNEQVLRSTQRFPRPLLKHEMFPLLHDLKKQGQGSIKNLAKDIRAFESAWARLQDETPGWPTNQREIDLERVLMLWLKFHQAMLIGELVPLALKYLRNNPMSTCLGRFDHILVDEYQDLNKAEQETIKILSKNHNLVVAGDDDQSIYSFKFAHPEGIIEFNNDNPGTMTEKLEVCRRCPKIVVKLASQLINKNDNRYDKTLLAHDGNPSGEVLIMQFNGIRKEAAGLATLVKHYIDNTGVRPGEVLILAQREDLAKYIVEELESVGLGYTSYYGDSYLKDPQLREKYALLCLLADPDDRIALRNWLSCDSITFNVDEYSRLRQYCSERDSSPKDLLESFCGEGVDPLEDISSLIERYKSLKIEIKKFEGAAGNDLIDRLFPEDTAVFSDIRNLAFNYADEDSTPESLAKTLREQIVQPEIPEERDDISIMSLHKAKGLEADLVIILGCVEGLLPYIDPDGRASVQNRQLEEGRRLFYVGITRSRRHLVLSNSLYMQQGQARSMKVGYDGTGPVVRLTTSRFIDDLGPDRPKVLNGEEYIKSLE